MVGIAQRGGARRVRSDAGGPLVPDFPYPSRPLDSLGMIFFEKIPFKVSNILIIKYICNLLSIFAISNYPINNVKHDDT
jgi:hypothetical protein